MSICVEYTGEDAGGMSRYSLLYTALQLCSLQRASLLLRRAFASSQQKQIHATNSTYERIDPALILSLICHYFVFDSAVVLDLDLPEGEGRKTALGEAPRNRCRPASALCPDMARGENQMSTSTDNNASPL